MTQFRIGLIGAPTVDEIHPAEGAVIRGFGGIYYNIIILSRLFGDEAEIVPICRIGKDHYELFLRELCSLKNVQTDRVLKYDGPGNKVILEYSSPTERIEYPKNILPPILRDDIGLAGEFDVLIVNFISGNELSRELFIELCRDSERTVYCDAHNLLMEAEPDGGRKFITGRDWWEWFFGVDFLQLNNFEAEVICRRDLKSTGAIREFCEDVLSRSVGVCQVTLGKDGSIIGYTENNLPKTAVIPPVKALSSTHSTGCGDAYASGFIYKYLKTKDLIHSARFANKIAAFRAGVKGSNELYEITKNLEECI